MYTEINQYLKTCVPLNDEQLNFVNSHLQKKTFAKKTFILQQGEVCQFEAFIVKGLVKTYFIDQNGFEFILAFACKLVGDRYYQFSRTKAQQNVYRNHRRYRIVDLDT